MLDGPERSGSQAEPLRERLRKQRVMLLIVGLVAFVNALAWGVITPPFQVPDEHKHIAYVEQIAVQGRPPRVYTVERPSPDLAAALRATRFSSVVFDAREKPPWSAFEDEALQQELARPRSRLGDAGASGAAGYPPLYYAAAGAATMAVSPGTLLDRIAAMRVLSGLLAAATVVFVFLFLKEVLPTSPWAWTLGAFVSALQPMLGFMGGGVNNDNGLFAAAAALFWLVARGFRAGLSARLAAMMGFTVAAGLLAKPTMLALLPGAALGIILAPTTNLPSRARPVIVNGSAFTIAAALPALLYLAVNSAIWERGGSVANGVTGSTGDVELSAGGFLSYTWQFYLPSLPHMYDWFEQLPLWEVWFQGWMGRFGWKDVEFAPWVYQLALALTVVLVVGLVRLVVVRRAELGARWREAVTFSVFIIGTLLVVHAVGYRYLLTTGAGFEQARYLLVLLPLYALGVVAAVRGLGRRGLPALVPLLLIAAVAHSLFAMLVTVARYYA